MSDSVLRTKSKEFAKDTVFLCRRLKQNGVENALINQLLPRAKPNYDCLRQVMSYDAR